MVDVIVIGTGSAGSIIAFACRKAGKKVAIIDDRKVGGTCALRGCDPKKVLVGAADLIEWNYHMHAQKIIHPVPRINWNALMQFKRTFTDPVPLSLEKELAGAGIALFKGRAIFVDEQTIQVGGEILLKGKKIVIATGAVPNVPPIPGSNHFITSDEFLELEKLPKDITFIGGGYISFEFAHIAARAGSRVRIIHRSSHVLKEFDPDLVKMLVEYSNEIGIDILLDSTPTKIEKKKDTYYLTVKGKSKKTIKTDLVVIGSGRKPALEKLNLEKAHIKWDGKKLLLNAYLQSISNPRVFAAGDAASKGPPLSPVAGIDGNAVAYNMLKANKTKPNYAGVASVVFSIPPLAKVGLTVTEARKKGLHFHVKFKKTHEWYSSRRLNERCSGFKVLVEKETGKILGAHILGENAEELINIFALAIRLNLSMHQLKTTPFAYPSHGSNVHSMFP